MALLGAALGSPAVLAHGQFPLPVGVLMDGDGGHVVVAATFGALVPTADGPGYHWICEELAGGDVVNAVVWAMTSEGTLLAGGRSGGLRFTQDYCGATRLQGVPRERVRTMVTHPSRPWVLLSTGPGAVLRSLDDGRTFALFAALPGAVPAGLAFDRRGDTPRAWILWRVLSDGHAELHEARDGGAVLALPTEAGAPQWELLGEAPAQPGVLWVRDNGAARDRLLQLVVADGGITLAREADDELVLAATPDGTRWASGGLVAPLEVNVNGTRQARTGLREVRALAFSPQRHLYVAADNWNDGFAAGVSWDDGVAWRGLGRFVDIRGVLACADAGPGCVPGADGCAGGEGNDVVAACGQYWPALVELFGIPGDGGAVSSDGGTAGPPARGCPGCSSSGDAGVALLAALLVALRRRSARPGDGIGRRA
ncbi:MAG: hypothetical protein HY904_02575 [Deltaproteobacteria bacterium]|nr:hypothetical protein [Deltaproteobacteria bacterium]